MATKAQVNEFIDKIGPLVVEVCKSKNRKILPSVCIAQACCESAYGTSNKMIKANAIFGIKVGSGVKYGTAWKGVAYDTATKECYNGKDLVTIKAMFRAYSSLKDSISDYYDLLGCSSRYSAVIGEKDYNKAIKDAGYATDPNYVKTITSIINTNNLTRFDNCMVDANKQEQHAVVVNTNTKHKLGEKVTIKKYTSSSTGGKVIEKEYSGVILKIIPKAKYPYAVGNLDKVVIGWTKDAYIINKKTITYKVSKGDTLSAISKKYGVSVSNIINWNKSKYPNIKSNYIVVGWKLTIYK